MRAGIFIYIGMVRPTILVAEPESEQSLSVRKLVLETSKYNVLTAHSTAEGIDLARMFPNLSAAVLVMDGVIDCERVAAKVKEIRSETPVVALSPTMGRCAQADHHLSSFEPDALVGLMRQLLGDPRQIDRQQQQRRGESGH